LRIYDDYNLKEAAMKHLIDAIDLSIEEINELITLALEIKKNPIKYSKACRGKKLATLFYEPSTRTRLSFEAAMIELGGNVLGFSSADASSASKGESVADTIRMISCYADICAIRHPKEGAAMVASRFSSIPVVNAGDGGHLHPTQTLTDMVTIKAVHNRLNNLTLGMCGDLKFGRTVHSLIKAMSRYENNKFILVSPEELRVPEYLIDESLNKSDYIETKQLVDNIPKMDILYMTRVQRERFFNEEDYVRLKDAYILNMKKLKNAKENLAILHPLPRVNEISVDIDSDPRALYFKQALYGKYIRMALIIKLLELN